MQVSVTVAGCSGSFAGPDSPASSYLLVVQDGDQTTRIVLDMGNGAWGALQRHLSVEEIDAVVISHLHPDHCLDLTGLFVARAYDPRGAFEERLPVYAPGGAARRLEQSFEGIGEQGMKGQFDFWKVRDQSHFEIGPVQITAFRVNHPVEAYGYRIQVGGVVIAYTGDTDSCSALSPLMRNADLVLADSAFVEGRDEVRGVHLSGLRAAQAAVDAGGVARLMLTHIPVWNDPQVCIADAQGAWNGVGVDGQERVVEVAQPDATYVVEAARR